MMRYSVNRHWPAITPVTKLLCRDTAPVYEALYTRYTFFKYPRYISDSDMSAHSGIHFSIIDSNIQ